MTNILTINGGSSSIRFALFSSGTRPTRLLQGKLDRIGTAGASMRINKTGDAETEIPVEAKQPRDAIAGLAQWLKDNAAGGEPQAIGHRVVHGMRHQQAERLTAALLADLKRIEPYDPEHLPQEIELIETLQHQYPGAAQVACYDTAFHRDMPRVAQQLPIPRRFEAEGVRRYGFHGLSYTYLWEELKRLDESAACGKVILAHLGGGASLAAVLHGRSMDTSMGFTPTGGIMMGTRSGDLDPGLLSFLSRHESLSAAQIQKLVNHESGLLGVSESSADVRDLLQREGGDVRAREALDLYCYLIKKWVGSFAAVLAGVDVLVFAGGVGENSHEVRARACAGLGFLGIEIDATRNRADAAIISAPGARVQVRVIRTDEELIIARETQRVLGLVSATGAQ
jgi:acetate kinase